MRLEKEGQSGAKREQGKSRAVENRVQERKYETEVRQKR